MKKIVTIFLLIIWAGSLMSQTKSGTVYSEHEGINKTREMWKAFTTGDYEGFISYFADSLYEVINGKVNIIAKDDFKPAFNYWNTNFEGLEMKDQTPATPDAIEYSNGMLWVQDWMLITGTHKISGINLNLPMHHLYAFDKAGKINTFIVYYDSDVFDEINNSGKTIENGTVYSSHPYIVKVRKMVNAYSNKNLDELVTYFSPKAKLTSTAMKPDKTITLEAAKKAWQSDFDMLDNIKMEQVGYPDCVHYVKGDMWVVYSWWNYSFVMKESGKQVKMPIMMSCYFNPEGKVVTMQSYFSTNHFE